MKSLSTSRRLDVITPISSLIENTKYAWNEIKTKLHMYNNVTLTTRR